MNKKQKVPTYLIFGLPGSGKSLQAKKIEHNFGFVHISSGNVLRNFIKENKSPKAEKVKEFISQGQPVPDQTMSKLIKEKIGFLGDPKGIILDNYPFNSDQMDYWQKEIASRFNLSSLKGIYLDISREESLKRLSERLICPDCHKVYKPKGKGYKKMTCPDCGSKLVKREDDKPEVVKKRLNKYQKPIKYLKKYFKSKNKLIKIDGEQKVEAVYSDIKSKLKKDDELE